MKKIGSLILIGILALGALVQTGCVTAIKQGDIVSITERGFGVKVTATSSTTQTPEVWLGFYSSTVSMIPTSTNAVWSPNFANTFAIGQKAVPFTFDVGESIASGDYQTDDSTNVTSQPVVPKQ
jgi:hypothetical protein